MFIIHIILITYFIYSSVYILIPNSYFIPIPFSPLVTISFSYCCCCLFWLWCILIVAHRLSYPTAYGILVPWPGIEPLSPASEGRFLTTGPPGKPHEFVFYVCESISVLYVCSFVSFFRFHFFLFSFVFARWIPQHMQSWSLIFLFVYCLFLKKRSLLETFEEIVEFHPFVFVLQELDVVLCVYDGIYFGCKCASCGNLKFVSWMQPLEFHPPELDYFQL